MSNIKAVLLSFAATMVLFGCGTGVSDAIFDDFKRVNAGLERSFGPHDSAMAEHRRTLLEQGCMEAVLASDTLRSTYASLAARIDSLKLRIISGPPGDPMAADNAYALNGTGDRMHSDLLAYFDRAARLMEGDPAGQKLAELGKSLEEPPAPETWRITHFHHVPAVAAITVLSKFRSNAAEAEALCMDKLVRDCMDKGTGPVQGLPKETPVPTPYTQTLSEPRNPLTP